MKRDNCFLFVAVDFRSDSAENALKNSVKKEEAAGGVQNAEGLFFSTAGAASFLLQSHHLLREDNSSCLVLPSRDERGWSFMDSREYSLEERPQKLKTFIQKTAKTLSRDDLIENGQHQRRSAALSKALCRYRRWQLEREKEVEGDISASLVSSSSVASASFFGRMVFICFDDDDSKDYIPLMNAVFSASKMNVTIDAVAVGGCRLPFLSQAAELTGGSVLSIGVEDVDLLASHLVALVRPHENDVDYRTACRCHNNYVDRAFVCSVCLTVYCEERKQCMVCSADYEEA